MPDVVYDAIVAGDVHLGLLSCRVQQFIDFLENIRAGHIQTEQLIFNGDLFDSINFEGWPVKHRLALSLLRSLIDQSNDPAQKYVEHLPRFVLIIGNHEGKAAFIERITGLRFKESHSVGKVLILHGHEYDRFISDHPKKTKAADAIYRALQRVNVPFANWLKDLVIHFADCHRAVERGAVAHAHAHQMEKVIAGHTHREEAGKMVGTVEYWNPGCWCSARQPFFLGIREGMIELHEA